MPPSLFGVTSCAPFACCAVSLRTTATTVDESHTVSAASAAPDNGCAARRLAEGRHGRVPCNSRSAIRRMATVSPAHADSVVFMGCRAERGGINWPLCWAGRRCSRRSDRGCLASAVAGTLVDPSSTQQFATAPSGRVSPPAQSYREFAPFESTLSLDPRPSTRP